MFGKLLKYEFRSYFKSMFPVWGAILVLSLVNGFTLPRGGLPEVVGTNAFFTFTLPLMLFVCCFLVMAVLSLVLTIQRFWHGLLGNEGYLMFTLPVSRAQLIGSKLFVSVVIQLISAVVVFLSVMILGTILGRDEFLSFFSESFRAIAELFRQRPGESWTMVLILFELFILLLASTAGKALHLYASMSLGHLSKKQKIAVSVIAWAGLNAVITNVGSRLVLSFFIGKNPKWLEVEQLMDLAPVLLFAILCILALDAVYWFITQFILQKKLNLE